MAEENPGDFVVLSRMEVVNDDRGLEERVDDRAEEESDWWNDEGQFGVGSRREFLAKA